jgi:hypothetical protein
MGTFVILPEHPSCFLAGKESIVRIWALVVQFFKIFFLGAAFGATPIIGQIVKGCARRNIALVVADFGIVDVFGTGAFITVHFFRGHRLVTSVNAGFAPGRWASDI